MKFDVKFGVALFLVILITHIFVYHIKQESFISEDTMCKKLALMGECQSDPVRMLWGCPRSCGTAGMTENQKRELRDKNLSLCKDFASKCPRMSVMECNSPAVRLRCRRSCNVCK